MGNEARGHGIIGACTHNGTGVAVVMIVQASSELGRMIIRGQGKRGASVNTFVTFMRKVLLSFVGQGGIAFEAKGSLVVHLIRPDFATIDTLTWTTMKAFEDTISAEHATGNHDSTAQVFEHEGDGDTDNLTYSFAA